MYKTYYSVDEAVADASDGASIAFGSFYSRRQSFLLVWATGEPLSQESPVNRQRKWATSGIKDNGHLGLAPAPQRK